MTKGHQGLSLALKKAGRNETPRDLDRILRQLIGEAQGSDVAERALRVFEAAVGEWGHLASESRPSASVLVRTFRAVAAEVGASETELLERLLSAMVEQAAGEKAGRHGEAHRTKERILAAAQEVFSQKGFHQATMDEIAERAEVGKGTIYRHFPSKESLFHQLVHIRLKELEAEAERILDSDDDVLSMIEKYLHIYFEFFDRNQGLYRVMVHEHPDLDERLQDLYVEKIMRRIPRLKRKIREARQQQVLKDVNFHTVFHGVMGFIHGVIQRWLAQDCTYSLVDELPTVRDVLFYGFVNRPITLEEERSWTSTQ
uniref:TetR/AcrR family transcriptional regulator n=1 Tax=Desulfacinum infernum TaxID=35837 RepID=A0A832A1D9_9BACT